MGVVQTGKCLNWKAIRIDPKEFRFSHIMELLTQKALILPSVLQERTTWNTLLRSRLIESVMLGIPLSTIYFMESAVGDLLVLDGAQRLLALRDYVTCVYPLEGLQYYGEELNGKIYDDLALWRQTSIMRTCISIQVVVHQYQVTTNAEKLNIFERIRFPEHLDAQGVYRRKKYLGLVDPSNEWGSS